MNELTPPDGPPTSEGELMGRADRIAGRTVGELAEFSGDEVPPDLSRDKGWLGRLVERWLGANAGNRPVPDFERLGVELKTLPVDGDGRPYESTYVCMVPLTDADDLEWDDSVVQHKLAHVLWIPILAAREIELARRMIGQGILWSPNEREEEVLRRDWEAHVRVIREGYVDNIDGSDGEVLQIRPKAANSRQLTWGVDPRGEAIMTMPRGFYLRTLFTEHIVRRHFYG